MKLQRREIAFIIGGILVVLVFWLFQSSPGSAAAGTDSLRGLLATVRDYEQLESRVVTRAEDLHVALPVVDPAGQEVKIREALGRLAQSSGVKLGTVKRTDSGSRSAAAQTVIDFQLDVTGNYDSLVKFIHALESDLVPFQVAELRVEPEAGGGRGDKKKPEGKIRSTMKVRGYLFPRVFLEKEKEEKKPEPRQPRRSASGEEEDVPEATPPPEDGKPAQVKEEKKEEATPAPEAAVETPEPGPSRPRRVTVKVQGMEIVIDTENRTVTMNGETRDIPADDWAKFEDGSWKADLPADAEVTEE